MTAIIDQDPRLTFHETAQVADVFPSLPAERSVASELAYIYSESAVGFLEEPAPTDVRLMELTQKALDWLQAELTEAHGRATPNQDGTSTLTDPKNSTFSFVIGSFKEGHLIKLGTNGVHTLVYEITDESIYRHVSKDNVISGRDDISKNHPEVASVAKLVQQGV